jgi:hypothetical protein
VAVARALRHGIIIIIIIRYSSEWTIFPPFSLLKVTVTDGSDGSRRVVQSSIAANVMSESDSATLSRAAESLEIT